MQLGNSRNTTQTSLVTVVVKRSNDHSPSCQITEIHVSENKPSGSIVGRLHASDSDSGADSVLSFKLLSAEDDVIHVESSTGIVRNKVEFDAEKKQKYSFIYEVQDYGKKVFSSALLSPCSMFQEVRGDLRIAPEP